MTSGSADHEVLQDVADPGIEAFTAKEIAAAIADTSIIIALKDDMRILDCLASVDEDVEVVIILNGSPPNMRDVLSAQPKDAVVTEIPDTGNLGMAYNEGARVASGTYLIYMDSDCTFRPGTIRTMVRAVMTHPVVKGLVVYGESIRLLSQLTARMREYDEGDFVSAQSPPLIIHRGVEEYIGGYHYDPLIHWCEDREFDFRLQMAGIPVVFLPEAVIYHDVQEGFNNLRSYWRYGIGEGIGQQLGVFTTPMIPVLWRALDSVRSVIGCAIAKGPLAACYYAMALCAFHTATLYHLVSDPYRVRHRFPPTARRTRTWHPIRQHGTALTPAQRDCLLRAHHLAGRMVRPADDLNKFRYRSHVPGVVVADTEV